MNIEVGQGVFMINLEKTFFFIQYLEMKKEEKHLKMENGTRLELK